MRLSKEQYAQLLSAGFTERQVNTMQEKFYTLMNTVVLPEPEHLQAIAGLHQQVKLLRDAVMRAKNRIQGLSEMLLPEKDTCKYIDDALAATEADTKQGLDGPVPNLKPADDCGIRYVE